jgi:hypothetical protein
VKVVRYASVAVLLGGGLLTPASAGSEDDPEVRGEDCRPDVVHVRGEYSVCKAWFSASPASPTAVTTTVKVAGDLAGRVTPIRVAMTWARADGCREGWQATDAVGGPVQLDVLRVCPGSPAVRVAMDPARAIFEGDSLRVDLTSQDLTDVGSGLKAGDRLARPIAGTRLVIRPTVNGLGEVSTLGGDTPPGRDFVVPEVS